MNSREVIKKLKREGWYLLRIKRDHHQFKHPYKKGLVTVPHPTKDLRKDTLASIKKQAGW